MIATAIAFKRMADRMEYRLSKNINDVATAMMDNEDILNVDVNNGVSLDRYLTDVQTPDMFSDLDFWKSFPEALQNKDKLRTLEISKDEASSLLERFNAYTWDERPRLKEKYLTALGSVIFYTSYNDYFCSGLSKTIEKIKGTRELNFPKHIESLEIINKDVKELEKIFKPLPEIPETGFTDYFTRTGRERIDMRTKALRSRQEYINGAVPHIREFHKTAKRLLLPLTSIGRAYRKKYIEEYCPHLLNK